RGCVEEVLRSADLAIDRGRTYGDWSRDSNGTAQRVFIDVDPAFTQMEMEAKIAAGKPAPEYDHYYTVGLNIGTDRSTAPVAGKRWRTTYNPVAVDLFPGGPSAPDAPFTTVMNWQSYESIDYGGKTYGQKDVEFRKFMDLPGLAGSPLEVAVGGETAPRGELRENGWRIESAQTVTLSVDSYLDYIRASRGEFSVCKNVYVATNSGWFSDRSAAYLASGRPVVMQETGFSSHLPCGRGLFAVRDAEEAAAAMGEINGNYDRHSGWARDIAAEYLDTRVVLGKMLRELGV
ncbi:MAG TPA: hypothetical protein VGH38_27395, partial [Bryobacteraceae bacterium]